MEKETLEEAKDLNYWRSNAEEAAKRLYPIKGEYFDKEFYMVRRIAFIEGAKWQQERMCNHTYILISEQGHRIIKCQKCDNTQPI